MALFRSEPDGDGKCWKGFVVMATTQRDEKLAGGAGSGADREGFRRVRWWPCLRPTLRGRDAVIATPAAGSVECIFMTNPADAPATGKREGPCGSAFRYGTADSVGSSAVKCVVKLTTLRWIREQCRNGAGEQVPAQFQFFFAEAVGEEAEVADALKAGWQRMDQKAADELFGGKGHDARLLRGLAAIVLPLKSHLAIPDVENALIGKRDSVGITAEILQNPLRAAERRLCIDHPFGLIQRFEIFSETGTVPERCDLTEELKLAVVKGFTQSFEKETAKQPRQDAHRKKKTRATADPLVIRRQAATGHDEMHVGMMEQVLSPGMQYAEEADLGSEVLGIARDGEKRLRSRPEENAVDHVFVVEGDAGQFLRNGENDVIIRDG